MSHVLKFRKSFKIDPKADLRNVAVAIDAVHTASEVGFRYLNSLEPGDDSSGFRVRVLSNLLARIFEHVQGMLVAIATGSPSSSEALGRIVVEGSINVMYLAALGNASTIVQFFRSWINEHVRKLTEWSVEVEGHQYASRVRAMIEARREMVLGLEQFISSVEHQCSVGPAEGSSEWPKAIFKRFQALGRQTDYYESYHRLSGSSHITGEDTLLFLMASQSTVEHMQKLGAEAWAYSTMMSRIASTFFVDAVAACVISHGRTNNDDLQGCRQALWRAVEEISKAAGVPNVSAGIA